MKLCLSRPLANLLPTDPILCCIGSSNAICNDYAVWRFFFLVVRSTSFLSIVRTNWITKSRPLSTLPSWHRASVVSTSCPSPTDIIADIVFVCPRLESESETIIDRYRRRHSRPSARRSICIERESAYVAARPVGCRIADGADGLCYYYIRTEYVCRTAVV